MLTRRAIALWGAVALAPGAFAQTVETVRLTPSTVELASATREHFEMRLLGEKVGWLMHEMGPAVLEGEDVLVWRQEMLRAAVYRGRNWEEKELSEQYFASTPPHAMVLARREVRSRGYLESIEVRPEGDGVLASVEKAGRRRTLVLPDPDISYADLLTPHLWIAQAEREVGDSVAFRSFDMGLLRSVSTVGEVTGVHEDEGGERIYEVSVRKESGLSPPQHFDAEGRFVGGTFEGLALVDAAESEARAMAERPANVWKMSRWAIDKKVGNPKQIAELVLETRDDLTGQIAEGPLQSVRRDAGTGVTTVSLGAAHGKLEPVTDEARDAALSETAIHPIHDERVQRLAKDAVAHVSFAPRRVQLATLLKFVDAYIVDDMDANPPTLFDILDQRRGDCTEHALMFVTFARALGFPAREVDGYVHGGDHPPEFALHRWVEVELDGRWHPMDPSWSEVELNATHLRLGLSDGVTDTVPLSVGVSFKVKRVGRVKQPGGGRR